MAVYSVTKPDIISDPSYSPDGIKIIFVEKIGSTYSISTITDEATPDHITLISGALPYADPFYSVDGRFILFSMQVSGETLSEPYGVWSIYYMYADGSGLTTVVDDGNANLHPCWVTPIQIGFQFWQYGATPSAAFQIGLIDLAGQGRMDIGTGSYPRTVTA